MAEKDYKYEQEPVLSKVKIGGVTYYLKDAEARKAIDSILNDYLTSVDKTELEGKITAEETRAKAAEKALDDAKVLLQAEDVRLAGLIDDEEAARASADKTLQDQIDAITAGLIKIKSGEKVLALDPTSKELSTTLSINYDSTNRKIQLKGINDALVSEIDASAFIKDGMLWGQKVFVATGTSQEVSITKGSITQTHVFEGLTKKHQYMAFCFTDGAVPTPTYSWEIADLQDLVDVYTGGNGINITNNVVTAVAKSGDKYIEVTSTGIASKGIDDAIATAKGEATTYADGLIAQEVSDRNAAILVETNRAKGVEEGLQSSIDGLDDRLDTAESDITSLKGRVTTNEGNISTLQSNLSDEIARAKKAEGDLSTDIEKVADDLAAEIIAARAGEGTAEANAKSYADGLVATERGLRETADSGLDTRIKVFEANGAHDVAALEDVVDGIDTRLGTAETKLAGIESGAQVNKIESIKLNGNVLPISGKQVDLGSIATDERVAAIEEDVADHEDRLDVIEGTGEGSISKGDADTLAAAKTYADGKVNDEEARASGEESRIEGKVDSLSTEFTNHTHSVTASGTITPNLTKSEKYLGINTTESDEFVKSVGKTTKGLEVAEYVNNVGKVAQSFGNLTATVGSGTDSECLIFSTSTIAFDSVGTIGTANAATGALGTGSGLTQVMIDIDASSKGTALKTATLNNDATSGVAYVESVVGASTNVSVSGTAAKVSK